MKLKHILIILTIISLISFFIFVLLLYRGSSKTNQKPKITQFTITPEKPVIGQKATLDIRATDDNGIKNIELTIGSRKIQIDCNKQKICSKQITEIVPDTQVKTITLKLTITDTKNKKTTHQKQIVIIHETEEPECGNDLCETGETEENCPSDCEIDKTCLGLGGEICTSDETCTGIWLDASDTNRCCDNNCEISDIKECGNGICEEGEDETNCPLDCEKEGVYGKVKIATTGGPIEKEDFEFLSKNYVSSGPRINELQVFIDEFGANHFDKFNERYNSDIIFFAHTMVRTFKGTPENFESVSIDEEAFAHSQDPAGLVAFPASNNVSIAWNNDYRENLAKGYNIYGSRDGVQFFNVDYTESNEIQDNTPEEYYKVKTVLSNGTEINYSWTVHRNYDNVGFYQGTCNPNANNIDCNVKFYGSFNSVSVCFAFGLGDTCNVMERQNDNYFFSAPANPQVETIGLFYYFKGETFDKTLRFPTDNYYTTNGNNRLKAGQFNEWAMNPSNKHWQDVYLEIVRDMVLEYNYNGIHADGAGDKCFIGMYDCTDSEFANGVKSFLKKAREELDVLESETGRELYLSSSILRPDNNNDPFGLLEEVDVGGLDCAAYNSNYCGGYMQEDKWIEGLNRAIKAEQVYNKIAVLDNVVEINNIQARMFVLGTYFLVRSDDTALSVETIPSRQGIIFWPEWNIDIGNPLETYSDVNSYYNPATDLYERDYQFGKVIVNPKEYDIFLDIPPGYKYVEVTGGNVLEIGGDGVLNLIDLENINVQSKMGVILLKV